MVFSTDNHYIHEYSNSQYNLFRGCSILPNITKTLIITKFHPNHSILVSAVSTEQPSGNGGQTIVVSKIGILL